MLNDIIELSCVFFLGTSFSVESWHDRLPLLVSTASAVAPMQKKKTQPASEKKERLQGAPDFMQLLSRKPQPPRPPQGGGGGGVAAEPLLALEDGDPVDFMQAIAAPDEQEPEEDVYHRFLGDMRHLAQAAEGQINDLGGLDLPGRRHRARA